MRAGERKTNRRKRNYAQSPVSMIVRYDMVAGSWIHSTGLLLSPREVSVLSALAYAEKTTKACIAACCSEKLFDNTVVILKRRFNVQHRSQLIQIAAQLFPVDIALAA
jgi:hypothetical protein